MQAYPNKAEVSQLIEVLAKEAGEPSAEVGLPFTNLPHLNPPVISIHVSLGITPHRDGTRFQALMAEGTAMRPEALSPLDGALAVLKQYAAEGGGLREVPCCGELAGGGRCPDAGITC